MGLWRIGFLCFHLTEFIMKHMFDYLTNKKSKAMRMLALAFMVLSGTVLWAEGSRNFVSYPGFRLFLDNRNEQQRY